MDNTYHCSLFDPERKCVVSSGKNEPFEVIELFQLMSCSHLQLASFVSGGCASCCVLVHKQDSP